MKTSRPPPPSPSIKVRFYRKEQKQQLSTLSFLTTLQSKATFAAFTHTHVVGGKWRTYLRIYNYHHWAKKETCFPLPTAPGYVFFLTDQYICCCWHYKHLADEKPINVSSVLLCINMATKTNSGVNKNPVKGIKTGRQIIICAKGLFFVTYVLS